MAIVKPSEEVKKEVRGCPLCANVKILDWRQAEKLMDFLTTQGRIQSREFTRVCARHQKELTKVIKQARHLALMPFVTKAGE